MLALDVPRLRRGDPVDEVVPAWFVLAGLWGFGRWIRHRRGESAALAHRARAAEEGAAARAAQAVSDEQARIGRELHDLVAHSMGVIVIQAQGAQRALDHDPARARSALSAIESTGRSGLAELRRLLVHLQVEGDVRPLPAGLELCAYRVVQESLTNILKHAGPATADVLLGYLPDVLDITVRDSGARPDPDSPPGHGLVGMRQRVLLYGGTLDVGAAPGGGFAIHARLPLEGEQP